ncbi:MAG: hypothetical protein KDD33_11905 [Bdellovibrionales bacterium]|nr:hypothetical protein [Bdellovibrionales bacterium]
MKVLSMALTMLATVMIVLPAHAGRSREGCLNAIAAKKRSMTAAYFKGEYSDMSDAQWKNFLVRTASSVCRRYCAGVKRKDGQQISCSAFQNEVFNSSDPTSAFSAYVNKINLQLGNENTEEDPAYIDMMLNDGVYHPNQIRSGGNQAVDI